jgi:hypothetical protein
MYNHGLLFTLKNNFIPGNYIISCLQNLIKQYRETINLAKQNDLPHLYVIKDVYSYFSNIYNELMYITNNKRWK